MQKALTRSYQITCYFHWWNQCGEALSQPEHPLCSHCLWLCLQEPRGQRHPLHPSRCLCQDEEPAAAVSDCPAHTLRQEGSCWPWMWAAALLLSTSALIHCPLPCVLLSGVFLHMRSCHGNILHVTVSEIRSLGQVLPAGLCLCNYSSPFRKSSPGPVSQLSAHTTVDLIPSGPSAPVLELCLGFTHRTDTAVISSIWTASTCHSGSWCKNTDVLSELLLVLQAGALHCYQTLFPVLPGFLFSSSP